jgi:hypothetical protein
MLLTLQPDLNQLEWRNHKSLGSTSRRTSQNRERLVRLGNTEHIPVDFAPLVVGSELSSTLRSLYEDRSRDIAVKTRNTVAMSIACPCSCMP